MQYSGILTVIIICSFIGTFTGWPVFYLVPSKEVISVVCQRQEPQRTMMFTGTSTPKRHGTKEK